MSQKVAIVHLEKCNPEGCGNFLCIRLCPINRRGEECIIKNEKNKIEISESLCIGCKICSNRCPFNAIQIINLPSELKTNPVHQYSKNGFRLFNIPTIKPKSIIGIIGVNGIGKTTTLNILSNTLKPNLGRYNKEVSEKEILNFFKGTETQEYFKRLYSNQISISYKPQKIDDIPKYFNDTVMNLLNRVSTNNEKIISLFNLEKIKDRNIRNLSGGELQRVAIAATVLKDTNTLIFDEPTSFLDIKQRLLIAKKLKETVNETKNLLLVEHDLIFLDFLSDYIHIMYGKPQAYGIISQIKSAKEGINTFLRGFLKEENIRFRDNAIMFYKHSPTQSFKERKEVLSWNEFDIDLGSFKLISKPGNIPKSTVIGILGENGIGKTTFIKALAGIQEVTNGKISNNVKISYKPQYINFDPEEKVKDILKEAIINYRTQLIIPLELTELLNHKIKELSGGELQRVAIAECLSKDSELYLLDEPSAYLDVEQRLKVSKIIKSIMEEKNKSALVVDHDLLFIDYISDLLLVFKGVPAIKGEVIGPLSMEEGMNLFLKELNITFRRDEETKRPRVNKLNSVNDKKQKNEGRYYY